MSVGMRLVSHQYNDVKSDDGQSDDDVNRFSDAFSLSPSFRRWAFKCRENENSNDDDDNDHNNNDNNNLNESKYDWSRSGMLLGGYDEGQGKPSKMKTFLTNFTKGHPCVVCLKIPLVIILAPLYLLFFIAEKIWEAIGSCCSAITTALVSCCSSCCSSLQSCLSAVVDCLSSVCSSVCACVSSACESLAACVGKVCECWRRCATAVCEGVAAVVSGVCDCVAYVCRALCDCVSYVCGAIYDCLSYVCRAVCNCIGVICESIYNCIAFVLTSLCECVSFVCTQICRCMSFVCNALYECVSAICNAIAQCLIAVQKFVYTYVCEPLFTCIQKSCSLLASAIVFIAVGIYSLLSKVCTAFALCVSHLCRLLSDCTISVCTALYTCLISLSISTSHLCYVYVCVPVASCARLHWRIGKAGAREVARGVACLCAMLSRCVTSLCEMCADACLWTYYHVVTPVCECVYVTLLHICDGIAYVCSKICACVAKSIEYTAHAIVYVHVGAYTVVSILCRKLGDCIIAVAHLLHVYMFVPLFSCLSHNYRLVSSCVILCCSFLWRSLVFVAQTLKTWVLLLLWRGVCAVWRAGVVAAKWLYEFAKTVLRLVKECVWCIVISIKNCVVCIARAIYANILAPIGRFIRFVFYTTLWLGMVKPILVWLYVSILSPLGRLIRSLFRAVAFILRSLYYELTCREMPPEQEEEEEKEQEARQDVERGPNVAGEGGGRGGGQAKDSVTVNPMIAVAASSSSASSSPWSPFPPPPVPPAAHRQHPSSSSSSSSSSFPANAYNPNNNYNDHYNSSSSYNSSNINFNNNNNHHHNNNKPGDHLAIDIHGAGASNSLVSHSRSAESHQPASPSGRSDVRRHSVTLTTMAVPVSNVHVVAVEQGPARPPSPSMNEVTRPFACDMCTFYNEIGGKKCEVCFAVRRTNQHGLH